MKKLSSLIIVFCFFQLRADMIVNGYGTGNIILSSDVKLIVENSTTTTLKNLTLTNLSGDRLIMGGTDSSLALENVTIFLDGDYSFTQGQLYIHDSVVVSGTNAFAYQSTQQSYIDKFSTLYFDIGTTLSYKPASASRTLIAMADATSCLYLNGCTFYSTSTGLMLTNGTLKFDNLVTLSADGQVVSESISFGNPDDNLGVHDLTTKLLADARIESYGFIDVK